MRGCAQPLQGALILARRADRVAARLSADRPARRAHRPRRGTPVLSRIRIVERTGSTNADLHRRCDARSKATGWSRSSRRRAGPAGPRLGFARRAISTASRWSSCAPAIRRAQTPVAGRRPGADRSGRRRGARPAADAQMAQRLLLLGAQARRDPARAQRRPGRRRLRRQSRRRARACRTGKRASLGGADRAAGLRALARRRASRGCSALWRQQRTRRCSPRPGWPAPIRSGRRSTVHTGAGRDASAAASTGSSPTARCGCAATTARSSIVRAGDVEL